MCSNGDVMRVVAGKLKGKRLSSPDGKDVRPTPDMVKEALFSAIQFDIEGRRVLDLFAGSGQLGIEALSRGAESVVFVDSSKESVKLIKSNIEGCGLGDTSRVYNSDFAHFCAVSGDEFDIVFIDPPYASGLYDAAIKAVLPLLSSFAMVICEHPPEVSLPQELLSLKVYRTYRYGKVMLTVYRKCEADE